MDTGVFGTGVYVTGVAGTSVNNVGIYGQTGEIPTREAPQFPQNMVAGVFGAAPAVSGTIGWGVVGWSAYSNAVHGLLIRKRRRWRFIAPCHRRDRNL